MNSEFGRLHFELVEFEFGREFLQLLTLVLVDNFSFDLTLIEPNSCFRWTSMTFQKPNSLTFDFAST